MGALIFIWAAFAVLTAVIANSRGRDVVGWLALGAFFGVFALIAVIVLPPVAKPKTLEADEEWMPGPKRLRGYTFKGIKIDEFDDGSYAVHGPTGVHRFADRVSADQYLQSITG